jgi:hypothetical protein
MLAETDGEGRNTLRGAKAGNSLSSRKRRSSGVEILTVLLLKSLLLRRLLENCSLEELTRKWNVRSGPESSLLYHVFS